MIKLGGRRYGKEHLLPTLFGFVIISIFIWLQSYPNSLLSELLTRIDLSIYDFRLRAGLTENAPPDKRIVIVDIDEKSLSQQGQWPWPRNKVARMVENLWEAGAIVIVFDMVFAEEEINITTPLLTALKNNNASTELLDEVGAIQEDFDHDAQLARSFEQGDVVTGYVFLKEHKPAIGFIPPTPVIPPKNMVAQSQLAAYPSYSANIQKIQQKAVGSGFFLAEPDIDGVIRRVQLVKRYGNELYPALALEALRVFLFEEHINANFELRPTPTLTELYLGKDHAIPVNEFGEVLVPFKGPQGQFRYVSATDVVQGKTKPEWFDQSIVLIGTTAQGLFDLRSTPVARSYPGVEVHANLISSFLDRNFYVKTELQETINIIIAIVLTSLLAIVFPRLNTVQMVILTLLALSAITTWNFWQWHANHYDVSLGTPILLIISVAALNFLIGFMSESRGRELLKQRFGEYVPAALVEKMADAPTEYNLDGESREMTVLFADIRSFTTISESLDAAELKKMLNHFFTPMTKTIFDHKGTIDKYVGDMIMAFWGAPLHDDEHRKNAIDGALDMLKKAEALKPEYRKRGWPEINIGVGLNTGLMNVGDMGSEYRRAYTVLGDSVNLGSRLEGTTKYYGVSLVISEYTAEGLHDHYLLKKLDLVKVKGKQQAVTVYEPICLRSQATTEQLEEVALFHQCLTHYGQQNWQAAFEILDQLQSRFPERGLYPMYRDRIKQLSKRPHMDQWDGVYERREK